MILTTNEIIKHVACGNITINPFDPKNLGTISYRFKLGNRIAAITESLDSRQQIDLLFDEIPSTGYILEPNTLYLAQTHETMGATAFAQQIFAVRDIGSAGIFIHVSADLGHAGAITQWTLEITVDHRIKIYPYQFIGQMIFWHLNGTVTPYCGDYTNMPHSLPSKHWKELV